MSIADQINRLNNAKAAIKQSLANKGVTVSDSALLDEYPALIDSIPMEGGDPWFETMWNYITNNNTDYSYLFHNYNGTTLDVSNLDTSNVTNMSYMFYGCESLTQLDVSNWNTSKVTSMQSMFQNCKSLTTLDVSNFDTSNVTTMSNMFSYCNNLTQLDVSNWNTSNVTNMSYMFNGCTLLTSLDMSNWDISKCTSSSSLSNIFGAKNLTDLKAPKNINANLSVSACTLLTHDSLMNIINNLMAVTSTKTLTLGTDNLAKLTADEVAIATNKGWTVK